MTDKNRFTDARRYHKPGSPPPLPIIDWKRIGHSAPVPIKEPYDGPTAPLPKVDIVVMTWTSAEWSALDHVFCNSNSTRSSDDYDWEHAWNQYSLNAPPVAAPSSSSSSSSGPPLWGLYRVVSMRTARRKAVRVLVFKADSHLAHPPYGPGLQQMIAQIIDDTACSQLWSIGTAGGSREDENLGDVVITNAGRCKLKLQQNLAMGLNNKTFKGKWFPSTKLFSTVEKHLFFDMATVVTWPTLEYMLNELHSKDESSKYLTLADLVNKPLNPKNLKQSSIYPKDRQQLLTTDYYYIAEGPSSEKYCVLEMDDAVIASVALQKSCDFAFSRNISDPVVALRTQSGKKIDSNIRDDWSGEIYKQFGLYTSMNGALATWAAITAG